MTMPASLTVPLTRLARAEEHLQALFAEAQAFGDRNPYELVFENDADHWTVARIRITKEPPARLGVLLSDLLHSWRSALDNLVTQLILLNRKTPGRVTGFPLFDNVRSYQAVGVKRIKGVREEHAAIIEGLQPYPGRDDRPVRALGIVNQLSNLDKHREIHPALSYFSDPEKAVRGMRREPIDTEFIIEVQATGYGKALRDGDEIARMRASAPTAPEGEVEMNADFPVEIAFNDGLRLVALPAIGQEIRNVIERFAPDFA